MKTLEQAFNEFILAGQANGLTPKTMQWYQEIISKFVEASGENEQVDTIDRNQMRRYVVELRSRDKRFVDAPQRPTQDGGLSRSSVKSYITALHRFWRWCSEEYDIANPMEGIKRPKVQSEPKAIKTGDFIKLFNATAESKCGQRDRAFLCLLADTGLRRSGIAQLDIDKMDLIERRVSVREKGSIRWVYWTHYTQRAIEKWLAVHPTGKGHLFVSLNTGEALTGSGLYQITKRLKKRAAVTGRVNPHSFRHNFARMYLMSGGDVVTLARLLGHRDINLTASFYAVFSSDELAKLQETHSPLLQMLECAR